MRSTGREYRYRSCAIPAMNESSVHLHGVDVAYFLDEAGRHHDVAGYIPCTERSGTLKPLGVDVLFDGLHLEVHVALGPVVAAGLALGSLAFLLGLLLLFGPGCGRLRLLSFGLVLNQLGKAPHLVLRLGKRGVTLLEQGFQIGDSGFQLRNRCIERGLHVLYGKVQLEIGGV